MALQLGDLAAVFDPGMTFEFGGREYTIPAASATVGLWCRHLVAQRDDLDDDATPEAMDEAGADAQALAASTPAPPGYDPGVTFERVMLGQALIDELVAVGVPDPALHFLARVAFARVILGDEAAQRYFAQGGNPQPSGPANRQERRAAKKATKKASGSRTTSTAAAPTTRKAASGSGTTSRSTAKPPRKAAASGSRGKRS